MKRLITGLLTMLVCMMMAGCACTQEETAMKSEKLPAKPFNNTKVVQIGIVVRDVEKAAQSYADFFGAEKPNISTTETYETAKTEYRGKPTKAQAKLAFFKFENTVIELIEPVGKESTWYEFLDTNGPGVHHIAFDVKGMDDQIKLVEGHGAELVHQGRWTTYTGGRYAYMDCTDQLAVAIELLENF